ncbi:copper binding protein, plastocyanin/azurin family [Cenarchaeum symbiosum A]|uniref:Copper binding protein, plastocyanin/azurin family n=1 Tax=Cenarchaeum symbiosum (strain A) TaxID=414004 RepID=A0RTM3_CENSY|nr:copper binding protein, plastocyanin/azurin family [Cenarchaeum symbiosum A]
MVSTDKVAVFWTIALVAGLVAFTFMAAEEQSMRMSQPATMMERERTMGSESTGSMMEESGMMDDSMMGDSMMDDMMGDSMMDDMMGDSMASGGNADMRDTMMDDSMTGGSMMVISVSIPEGTSSPGCEVSGNCYIPSAISINRGDTVVWTNDDSGSHTVTSGDTRNGPDGEFDSSLISGGDDYAVTFDTPGTYDYYCLVHPWQSGVVEVS